MKERKKESNNKSNILLINCVYKICTHASLNDNELCPLTNKISNFFLRLRYKSSAFDVAGAIGDLPK